MAVRARDHFVLMTAKEKLYDVVEQLSEAEAEVAIAYIANLRRREAAASTNGAAGPVRAVPAADRGRSRLRTVTAVPAALLIALFIGAYSALLVIVVVVVVRG